MFLSVVELQQHEEEVRRSIPLVKLCESGPELHLHNTMIACVIFFIFIVQKKRVQGSSRLLILGERREKPVKFAHRHSPFRLKFRSEIFIDFSLSRKVQKGRREGNSDCV